MLWDGWAHRRLWKAEGGALCVTQEQLGSKLRLVVGSLGKLKVTELGQSVDAQVEELERNRLQSSVGKISPSPWLSFRASRKQTLSSSHKHLWKVGGCWATVAF